MLDGEPAAASVADSPALTLTLDLPFPMSQPDRDLWSDKVVGSLSLGLDGTVAVTAVGGEPAVSWSPSDDAKTFLAGLFDKLSGVARDKVRGHVRLAGSVLGPGAAAQARWFWLVKTVTHLVLVPHRDGRLRLPSAQRAIALSVSRDALRTGLPSGITVEDGTIDLEAATKAVAYIFNSSVQVRPLRLVVDERYAAAGEAVKAGLTTVNVELELVNGADLAAVVTGPAAPGEIVDGVLTDAASAAALEAVAGFTKPVPL